jgi:hypothetical protein
MCTIHESKYVKPGIPLEIGLGVLEIIRWGDDELDSKHLLRCNLEQKRGKRYH